MVCFPNEAPMDCVERYRISRIKSAQFGTRSAKKNDSTENDNVEAAEVTDDSDKDETMLYCYMSLKFYFFIVRLTMMRQPQPNYLRQPLV